MILTRSPLRITLGGGATDIKSFYYKYGGFCISAAINKFVYIGVHRTFNEEIILKYSLLENIKKIDDIKHPIIKESLKLLNFKTPQIEIVSLADIPSATGLGSSSSFTCALLKALYCHRNHFISPYDLAENACKIEIDKLKGNLGKQDQFISAYGGIQVMTFSQEDHVDINPLNIKSDDLCELEDSILLFFTGFFRNANYILKDQVTRSINDDEEMIKNLLNTKKIALLSKKILEAGDISSFGKLVHEHWVNKRNRSKTISNSTIDAIYDLGIRNGAYGGKLIGAGGGGFMMFIASDPKRLRKIMKSRNIEEVRFNFDMEGTKRII